MRIPLFLIGIWPFLAAPNALASGEAASRLARLEELRKAPAEFDALVERARLCFELGRRAANGGEALDHFDEGEEAAEQALKLKPDHPEAIVLYTANAGTAAGRRKNLGALFKIPKLVSALEHLKAVAPDYGNAAADRGLGMIYLNAPSVISVGSDRKAGIHLKAAYEKFPSDPANRIAWAEWLLEDGQEKKAAALAKELEKELNEGIAAAGAAAVHDPMDRDEWLERSRKVIEDADDS